MIKKLLYCLIMFVSISYIGVAQDAHFTQFFNSKIISSPSFVGTTNGSRFIMNFRDQWPVIPRQFVTYSTSFDHYFRRLKTGVGGYVLRDRAGDGNLTTTNVAMMYSYKIRIHYKWHAVPALKIAYTHRSVNLSNFVFGDQLTLFGIRPTTIESSLDRSVTYFDLGTSALFFSEKEWIAIGVDHLGLPNESMNSSEAIVPLKYYAMFGAKVYRKEEKELKTEKVITVVGNFKSQGGAKQLDIGGIYRRNILYGGFMYRGIPLYKTVPKNINHDAAMAMIGIAYYDWNVAYSYDFTISKLISHTGGAHEATIGYLFNQRAKMHERKVKRKLECPDF